MTRWVLVGAVLTLAACGPPVPDSGAPTGAGFQDYGDASTYRAQRDAELAGTRDPATISAPPVAQTPEAIAQAGEPEAPVDPNNPNISDEQDFDAVANRQSIESDAERLRRQAEAYEVIQPTALPSRGGAGGPNIVAFALSTRNGLGEKIYRRSALTTQARYQRNCAKYASADLAQEAFLRSGGPDRDRLGIDPDGDGFACAWDPRPFRRIASAG